MCVSFEAWNFGRQCADYRPGGGERQRFRAESTYSIFAHTSQAPDSQSTQDGGKAQRYGLYFLRAIFVAPGVQYKLANESAASAAASLEDITYGFQRAYLETHR